MLGRRALETNKEPTQATTKGKVYLSFKLACSDALVGEVAKQMEDDVVPVANHGGAWNGSQLLTHEVRKIVQRPM